MEFLKKDWVISSLLFAAALLIRFGYLFQFQHSPFFTFLIGDGEGYFLWGQSLAQGNWLGSEVFYQAPLYPYFLGILQSSGADLSMIRGVQMVLGSLACVFLYRAGICFFSRSAGIVAGGLAAVYAPAIFFDGLIQKASLGFFFGCLILWRLGEALQSSDHAPSTNKQLPHQKPNPVLQYRHGIEWGTLGCLLGLLALLRENALLLIPVVALWPLWQFRTLPWKRRLIGTVGCLIGALLVLGAVGIRNWEVGQTFTLTTSQFGPNLYIGNNPNADGQYHPLIPGHGGYQHERNDATKLAEQRLGRSLSPQEVSDYWFQQSWEFIRNNPGQWLQLSWRKWMLLWNHYEVPDTDEYYVFHHWSFLLKALDAVFHFGTLVILATFGMVWAWRENRGRTSVLFVLLITLAISILPFFIFGRYRFPFVPFLLLFAGGGIVACFRSFQRSRSHSNMDWKRWIVPLFGAGGAAVLTFWPITSPNYALGYHNLALAYEAQNQPEAALDAYAQVLEWNPQHFGAYTNRGNLYVALQQCERAIQDYDQALRLNPQLAEAYSNRGKCYFEMEQYEAALQNHSEAIQLQPHFPEAYYNRALVYTRIGYYDQAIRDYTQALSLNPNLQQAYRYRGIAYFENQQYAEAISDYSHALELDASHADVFHLRAMAFFRLQRFEQSLHDFNQAIALNPNLAVTYNQRGLVHMVGFNNRVQACADWQNACTLGVCKLYHLAQQRRECE